MLVLSRRKDETIMIGDSVEITVVDIRGDTIRLGITAPRTVSVHRKEIYDAIQQENIEAAQKTPESQAPVGGLDDLLKGVVLPGSKLSALSKLSGGGKVEDSPEKTRTRVITKFTQKEGPPKKTL
jgi:carbon storage regulator